MAAKKQPAGAKKSAPRKTSIADFETTLAALGRKLSAPSLKQGGIVLRFTDSGEECCIESTEHGIRVTKQPARLPATVQISGPANVLKAIIDGKKEASRAFVAGGIQVRGDLPYLETLLKA